nr:23S rRNA (uracil(1939)-C(5))-methyltransferase RlmD [Vicinamibacterales bacterium]
RLKRDIVQRAVDAAVGPRRVRVAPVRGLAEEVADPDAGPWGFRHKVHFAFAQPRGGAVVMGHMGPGSRRVFDARECPVHAPRGNEVAFAVKAALQRAAVPVGEPPRGVVRHVVSRVGRSSGEVVTALVATDNPAALRRVSREVIDAARPDGWHLNLHPRPGPMLFGPHTRHLAGRERVREDVAGVTFMVSPTAFFQTNVEAAAMLAAEVLAAVPRGAARVLDLYAGLGFFALPLARRGHRVTAVEESASAVEDGEVSARFNRLPASACRFVRSGVEQALERLAGQQAGFDAVVLDPPRAGASQRAIDLLRSALRPPCLVYVSCEPEALSRDLARLAQPRAGAADYRVAAVTPIDMFPHTAHVETVAVLHRDEAPR